MPYSLGLFANTVPRSSLPYLNWFNTAHFFNLTRYPKLKESLMKTGIVMANAAVGFLAAHLNQEEYSGYSDASVGITTALLGLGLSQLTQYGLLLKKRYECQDDCIHLLVSINLDLENQEPACSVETKKAVRENIDAILKSTQIEENPAQPSQALERRKSLLTQLQEQINNHTPEIYQRSI